MSEQLYDRLVLSDLWVWNLEVIHSQLKRIQLWQLFLCSNVNPGLISSQKSTLTFGYKINKHSWARGEERESGGWTYGQIFDSCYIFLSFGAAPALNSWKFQFSFWLQLKFFFARVPIVSAGEMIFWHQYEKIQIPMSRGRCMPVAQVARATSKTQNLIIFHQLDLSHLSNCICF